MSATERITAEQYQAGALTEDELQEAVHADLTALQIEGRIDKAVRWYHAANERSSPLYAKKLKRMGVLAGVADLTIHWIAQLEVVPGPGWVVIENVPGIAFREPTISRTGFIELKTKRGSLSKAQRQFRDDVTALGLPYEVCRSVADVRQVLKAWGVLTSRGSNG